MSRKSSRFFCALICLSTAFFLSTQAYSSTLSIEFLGMDVVYDGFAIYDAGSPAGGSGDPADADPLTAVSFEVDGSLAGPIISTDVAIDISILELELPVPASIPGISSDTGVSGIFDLLIGPGPDAFALALDVGEVTVTFFDSGVAQFVFGAEVTSDIFDQDLPYGLIMGTPVEVSFSANIDEGTYFDDGDFITGFEASGTGEMTGPLIPEPTTLAMALAGVIGLFSHRRR